MILATKFLYERGSRESRQPRGLLPKRWEEAVRDHSLTIFLVITGGLWIALYTHLNSEARWGSVVGNLVSEWTQILGVVLMTKKLMEAGSKEGG